MILTREVFSLNSDCGVLGLFCVPSRGQTHMTTGAFYNKPVELRLKRQAGIGFSQAENCFTAISDLPGAQQLSDQLVERKWKPFLDALARRSKECAAASQRRSAHQTLHENSIKMYDKQGSVLRIETTINNPKRFQVRRRLTSHGPFKWLSLRKGIADIRRRVQLSRGANEEALAVVGEPSPLA